MGLGEWIDSVLHHKAGEAWGGWVEILFWVVMLVVHGALIAFAAWRLAERHTDATGSSVLVPVKERKTPDLATATTSASSSSSSLLPRRRATSSSFAS